MDTTTPPKVFNWLFSASIFDAGFCAETIESSAYAVSEEALQDQLDDYAKSHWGEDGSAELNWAENMGEV